MKKIILILINLSLISINANCQTPGNSLYFDGADDYVSCPLPSVFSNIGTNDFTIELWVNPTTGNFQRIFFAQYDAANFAVVSLTSLGEIVFYLEGNGTNYSVQSLSAMNSLEWAHIAVSWDSNTQEAKIFHNGNEVAYISGVFVSSTGLDNMMSIGSKTDGSQVFTGEIDELAIWSIAKSECEVSFEMKDKKNGAEPNLVSYYNFDHGVAFGSNAGVDSLQDFTGNMNDGGLLNFALTGGASNWILSGADIIKFWGDISSVSVGALGLGSTIVADQYQWIYCDDKSHVPGAINVTFDPPTEDPNYTGVNDSYAVISTKGNCVDTSECYIFNSSVSVNEIDLNSYVSIYPNPSNGVVSIESLVNIDLIEIVAITGEVIQVVKPSSSGIVQVEIASGNGFYLVVLHTSAGLLTKKILVHNN